LITAAEHNNENTQLHQTVTTKVFTKHKDNRRRQPTSSDMENPSKNMHKLLLIFGIVSILWMSWLYWLEDKPNITPKGKWWYIYNMVSLGGWSTWIIYYTMIKSNRRQTPGPKPHKLWNLLHIVPIVLLNLTITKGLSVKDKGLLWFSAVMVFRYYRTIVTRFFYARYKVASGGPHGSEFDSVDCTVIVPTVGPKGNVVFEDMVVAILWNKSKRLVFSANKFEAQADIETEVKRVIDAFKQGKTSYQKQHSLGAGWDLENVTEIVYTYIDDSNKRKQTYHAIKNLVDTRITIMVDDTAIWHPEFLSATLPAFNDKGVGLVGTHKSVKYIRPVHDSEQMSQWQHYKKAYWAGLWNTIGALYLMRHGYETEASNTADGGVFAVSGRTMLILTAIVKSGKFEEKFLNEYVLKLVFTSLTWLTCWYVPFAGQILGYFKENGLSEQGFGPLLADDDNFITRWVINHGYNIKVQSSPQATITTVLGSVDTFKYIDQCKRWSRTTFRQNPIALFWDRTIWWKWPISVWIVYFPWMYNAALLWDLSAVINFCRSDLYLDSPNGNARLCYLIVFIWLGKLNKTWPWFWEHPRDFFLYFFPIPAYPLFGYYHSWLKVKTAFTCWNNEWSGRNIKKAEQVAGVVSGLMKE
jgi:hypothetical protein